MRKPRQIWLLKSTSTVVYELYLQRERKKKKRKVFSVLTSARARRAVHESGEVTGPVTVAKNNSFLPVPPASRSCRLARPHLSRPKHPRSLLFRGLGWKMSREALGAAAAPFICDEKAPTWVHNGRPTPSPTKSNGWCTLDDKVMSPIQSRSKHRQSPNPSINSPALSFFLKEKNIFSSNPASLAAPAPALGPCLVVRGKNLVIL